MLDTRWRQRQIDHVLRFVTPHVCRNNKFSPLLQSFEITVASHIVVMAAFALVAGESYAQFSPALPLSGLRFRWKREAAFVSSAHIIASSPASYFPELHVALRRSQTRTLTGGSWALMQRPCRKACLLCRGSDRESFAEGAGSTNAVVESGSRHKAATAGAEERIVFP